MLVKSLTEKPKIKSNAFAVQHNSSLWSYAFGLWAIRTLGCAPALVVLAFSDAGKHPTFILIDTAAWQLYGFLQLPFSIGFLRFGHSFALLFEYVFHANLINPKRGSFDCTSHLSPNAP